MAGCGGGCCGPGHHSEPMDGIPTVWVSSKLFSTVLVASLVFLIGGVLALASAPQVNGLVLLGGAALGLAIALFAALKLLSIEPSCVLCGRTRATAGDLMEGRRGALCQECAPWALMPRLNGSTRDATRMVREEVLQAEIRLFQKLLVLEVSPQILSKMRSSCLALAETDRERETVDALWRPEKASALEAMNA